MPNWKCLSVFEAAVRHGNFTRAAEELNVQQPAVSRQISQLEDGLGLSLILRHKSGNRLTPAGEKLYAVISQCHHQIKACVEDISDAPQSTIRIDATIGFANAHIIPNMARFRENHPDLDIQLITRDRAAHFDEARADIVIAFDRPDNLPGHHQSLLFEERLQIHASPSYPIPDNLEDAIFLQLDTGIFKSDWTRYFDGPLPAKASLRPFTSYLVQLEAAFRGEGLMISWDTMLAPYRKQGSLVAVGEPIKRHERGCYACLCNPSLPLERETVILHWLKQLFDSE